MCRKAMKFAGLEKAASLEDLKAGLTKLKEKM